MATKIVMPRLSLTMKTGTVGKWYKKEGETVQKGEPLVEVLSEKATYDLEAPSSGVLRKVLAQEGLDIPVDAALGVITAPDEQFTEADVTSATQNTEIEDKKHVLASPAAKRLAREHGLDLSAVKGSGPEGRIAEVDVQHIIEQKGQRSPKTKETIRLSGYRKTSAERVATSFRTAPHSTLVMEIDVSKAAEIHQKMQVSYTAIIINATAEALTEHPLLNSTLEGDTIKVFAEVNIGVAVQTENGLVVPVIHEANKKTLKETDAALKNLTEKARDAKLAADDLSEGTFTITNLGMYEVDFFTPIINPPEAGILAIGKISQKPVVVDGKIEIMPTLILSLSYDHRIVDGAPAAQFLQRIKQIIENPKQ